MSIDKVIEINAAIYSSVMSIHLGKEEETTKDGFKIQQNFEPEISLSLPRDAYLIYLQTMADEKMLRKWSCLKSMLME